MARPRYVHYGAPGNTYTYEDMHTPPLDFSALVGKAPLQIEINTPPASLLKPGGITVYTRQIRTAAIDGAK